MKKLFTYQLIETKKRWYYLNYKIKIPKVILRRFKNDRYGIRDR